VLLGGKLKMSEFGNSPENIRKGIESNRRRSLLKRHFKIPQPLKAIRLKCSECASGSTKEIKRCHREECSLWPFRFGHNPSEKELVVPEFDANGEKTGEHFYRGFP